MKKMANLNKLKKGDKVAILSPSFAAPGKWPYVYELGLKRVREIFGLEPVEFPATKKIGASKEERSKDLIDAFERKDIKAIITSLGGNDQVTYVKNLPVKPFTENPKPFFGYSDNTHFMNFLWLNNIPSYYGGSLLTQFAMQKRMDEYTVKYLERALFERGETQLHASDTFNEIGLNWDDPKLLDTELEYTKNEGWFWDGAKDAEGITWGGCVESIDELLRHGIEIPSLDDFGNVVFITETSEEIPESKHVFRVFRALGERGILGRVRAILVGRPKAWEFDKQKDQKQRQEYRRKQRETILTVVRLYNETAPVVQNVDFGHTDPQIPIPYGMPARIDPANKTISVNF